MDGVDVNRTSIVELRGAQVEPNENGGYGLIAASGSHLAIFGWESTAGSTLTANGNGFAARILDRERAPHDGVKQSEDGGVGADTQRRRQHDRRGKGGAPGEQPEGHTKIEAK